MRKRMANKVTPLIVKDSKNLQTKEIQKPKNSFGFKIIVVALSFFTIVFILFSKDIRDRAYAQIGIFSPTNCYGDATGLKKATGYSEALELDDDTFGFNKKNSASLTGNLSEIVCGNFEGEMPENLTEKRIFLTFSWGISPLSDSTSNTEKSSSKILENSTSKESEIVDEGAFIDELSAEDEEILTPEHPHNESEEDVINLEEDTDTEEDPLEDIEEAIQEETETEPEEIEVEEPEVPEEETPKDDSENLSFFRRIFYSTVYAQETLQSDLDEGTETIVASLDNEEDIVSDESEQILEEETEETEETEEAEEIKTAEIPEVHIETLQEETIQSDLDEGTETIVASLDNEEDIVSDESEQILEEVVEENTETQDVLQSDFEDTGETVTTSLDIVFNIEVIDETPEPSIKILYSLDGESWISLGTFIDVNYGDRFEMPQSMFSPEVDLSKVQIAVQTLSTFDENSQLYIDAMWLSVETEEEILVPTLPPEKLSQRNFEKKLFFNESSRHICEAEVFRINVSGKKTASARIILGYTLQGDLITTDVVEELNTLEEEKRLSSYKIEIGSLPSGIDIVFDANNGYVYLPKLGETVLDLSITTQKNAPKGDFTVPIIYTHRGDVDTSVICQINIVNQ